MMRILIIDTSTEEGYVALAVSGAIIGLHTFPNKEQSKYLLPYISHLLSENHLALKEIDLIAVCIGPGTFTGVRVGVMTAKSLSYGANIPVFGFNSFIPYGITDKALVLPAKKDHFYLSKNGTHHFITLATLSQETTPLASPLSETLRPLLPDQDISHASYEISHIVHYIHRESKRSPLPPLEILYLQPLFL